MHCGKVCVVSYMYVKLQTSLTQDVTKKQAGQLFHRDE